MNKSDVQMWLQDEYRQWQALLDEIGTTRMEQPGVNGDWSMKDIIAHHTVWNRLLVDRFRAAARGEPEPPPPWSPNLEAEDDINAWIFETNHEQSLSQVLEDMHQNFQQHFAVMESLPEDVTVELIEPVFRVVWLGDKRFPVGEFFHHFHHDHESDVRAWLARTEKQAQ